MLLVEHVGPIHQRTCYELLLLREVQQEQWHASWDRLSARMSTAVVAVAGQPPFDFPVRQAPVPVLLVPVAGRMGSRRSLVLAVGQELGVEELRLVHVPEVELVQALEAEQMDQSPLCLLVVEHRRLEAVGLAVVAFPKGLMVGWQGQWLEQRNQD